MHTCLALGFTIALGSALLVIPTAWADGGFRCGQGHAMAHHGHGQTGVAGHMLRRLLSHQQAIGLSEEQVATLRSVALDADRSAIRASADRQVSERELSCDDVGHQGRYAGHRGQGEGSGIARSGCPDHRHPCLSPDDGRTDAGAADEAQDDETRVSAS
jgi:hypothetical protein